MALDRIAASTPTTVGSVALNRSLLAMALLLAVVCTLSAPGGEAHAQTSVPAAPTGLNAPAFAHDSVTLSWDDPGDSSIIGHQVLRRSRDGDEYGDGEGAAEFVSIVGNTGSSANIYTDASVAPRTRYVYRVKAINPAGTSGQSSYLNVETAAAPTPPSAPTGLTAPTVSHHSATISWEAPGDDSITGYQVLRRSRDGDMYEDGRGAAEFVPIIDDTGSSATTYTDTSVAPRTRYVYRVKAINPAGTSGQSSYVNVETPDAPTPPLAPTGLTAPTVAHDSVTLSWDDPGDDSITAYQVLRRVGDSGSFMIIEENSGSADTAYTDTTVSADTGYEYRVMAVSDGGKSPESDNLSVLTLSGETSLTASLTGVRVRDITQSTATVDVRVDNADNTRVFLRYRPADDPRRTRILSATLKSSSVLLFNLGHLYPSRSQPLLPASDYRVEVSLDGDFSTGVIKTNLRTGSLPNTPGAPTITSVVSEDRSLVVAWSGPVDNGGTPITGYRVQWRLEHQAHMQQQSTATTGGGNLTIGSLLNRVPYMIRLVALNENGEGQVSEEVTATPGIIRLSVSVVDITQTTATARVRLGSAVNGTVYLRYRPSQQLAWTRVLSQTTSSDSVPFSFSGLATGTDYDAQASLTRDFSDLEAIWFRTAPVALTPGPPTNLTVKGRRHEIVVNWEAPASDGGSRISEYLVQWRAQSSSFHPVKRSLSTTKLSAVIDAPMIGPEHIVRVIAVNANGQGVASPEVSGTYHFEAPGPPTITALHRLDDRIELHWEPPEDDGGDRVTGYQIQHKRADETEWQLSFGDLLDTGWIAAYHHTWQMPGFEMGILYDFQMRARNEAGTSPWTRAHQVRAGRWGMPGTPVLIAISPGDGSLAVRWDSPSNTGIGKVRYYNVQWKLASDRNWNPDRERQLDDPDARRYTISGLENGLPYHVRLRVGAFGTSGWAYGSGTPSATHAVPDAPVIKGVSSADETLSVTWRAALNNGGQEISSYELEYEVSSGTDWKQATRSDRDMSTAQQITGLQNGKLYQVRIRAVNPTGNGDWATSSGIPEAPPGAVTIRGIAEVGETLVADTSHIVDEDGPVSVAYGYQWLSGANTEIVGAISSTYTVRSSDAGKTIKVRVSFTDDAGHEETLTSAATDTVRRPAGVLAWEGELAAGQRTDLSPVESGYSTYGDLGGSLSPDRFLLEGTTYRVKFLAHSRESLWLGLDRELPADFTLLVTDSHYRGSESMVPPSIEGVAAYWWPSMPPDWLGDDPVRVGLTVHPEVPLGDRQKAPVTGYFHSFPPEHDGIEDVSFRIFFSEVVSTTAGALRDHVLSVSGGTVSSVEAVGDEGMVWAVLVTPESTDAVTIEIEAGPNCALPGAICNADGRPLFNRMELDVAGPPPTAGEPTPQPGPKNNPATGPPTIRGEARVGATLRVSLSALDDADGLSGAVFSYQWLADDVEIQDATDSIHVLDADDEGRTIRVRVSFTDYAGNEETLTSEPAAALAQAKTEEAPTELPPAPFNLTARANGDGSVTVSWDAPDDDSITGYQVLRRHPGEAQHSMVESAVHTGGTETTYTDDDLTPDVLHAYSVRAMNAAGSSERSNYDNAVPHQLVPIDFGLGATTIYLTFDDGPREPHTAQMLDLLEKYGARATFFVTGLNAALHPDVIARMAAARHGIGNHTWQHERLTELSRENFNSTVGRTQEQIGVHATRCLRPPYGATDANTGAWAGSLGLQQMMWTFDSGDFTGPGVDTLVSRLSRVSHGSVVLLHENGGGGDTIEALRIMLDRWGRQGYQFKPVCNPPRVRVAPFNNPSEGAPTVTGLVQAGKVLTSETSGIADEDGLSGAFFSYQWYADNAQITRATNSSYLVAAEHEGKTISVKVSFADDADNVEQLTSVPTASVAEAERVSGSPEAPQDLSVSPTDTAGELTVTWNALDNHGGPAPAGYRVEWKQSSGYWGRQSDVREVRTNETAYKITGLVEALQYAVRVRAVSQGLEGAASAEVLAAPMGSAPLTAELRNQPVTHEGGGSPFSVNMAFSEAIDHSYIEFRDGSLEVDGGMVLEASRVDRRPDLWRLAILPHGSGHVTITLPSGRDCSMWGAICTADGKNLSNRLEFTVPGPGTHAPATGYYAVTGSGSR